MHFTTVLGPLSYKITGTEHLRNALEEKGMENRQAGGHVNGKAPGLDPGTRPYHLLLHCRAWQPQPRRRKDRQCLPLEVEPRVGPVQPDTTVGS